MSPLLDADGQPVRRPPRDPSVADRRGPRLDWAAVAAGVAVFLALAAWVTILVLLLAGS